MRERRRNHVRDNIDVLYNPLIHWIPIVTAFNGDIDGSVQEVKFSH